MGLYNAIKKDTEKKLFFSTSLHKHRRNRVFYSFYFQISSTSDATIGSFIPESDSVLENSSETIFYSQ